MLFEQNSIYLHQPLWVWPCSASPSAAVPCGGGTRPLLIKKSAFTRAIRGLDSFVSIRGFIP